MPATNPKRMPSLGNDFATVDAELRQLTVLRKQLRLQRRRRLRSEADAQSKIWNVAFILFVLTAPAPDLALQYLNANLADQRFGTLEDADEEGSDAAEKRLSDRYLETELQTLSEIEDGWSADIPEHHFNLAQRFREDARVMSWVQQQHSSQGVAPAPWLVMSFRRAPNGLDEAATMPSVKRCYTAGEVKWVQRFRRRLGLSLGTLPVGEVVPLESLREKASHPEKGHQRDAEWCVRAAAKRTKTGAALRSPFWDRAAERCKQQDPPCGHLFGVVFLAGSFNLAVVGAGPVSGAPRQEAAPPEPRRNEREILLRTTKRLAVETGQGARSILLQTSHQQRTATQGHDLGCNCVRRHPAATQAAPDLAHR